jgi:SpoIIAA-like
MIERIEEMLAGTVGLRALGKLSKSDYTEVLEPALREAVESGELRLVFVVTDFEGLEAGAIPEDVKTGSGPGSATTPPESASPSSPTSSG